LERKRTKRLSEAAIIIQKHVKRFLQTEKYKLTKKLALVTQKSLAFLSFLIVNQESKTSKQAKKQTNKSCQGLPCKKGVSKEEKNQSIDHSPENVERTLRSEIISPTPRKNFSFTNWFISFFIFKHYEKKEGRLEVSDYLPFSKNKIK